MFEKNKLRRMRRKDLLDILLLQNKKIKELEEKNKLLNNELEKKEIIIKESGTLAEASLKLTKIFEIADETASIYLKNIERINKKNSKKEKYEYNKRVVIEENKDTKEKKL